MLTLRSIIVLSAIVLTPFPASAQTVSGRAHVTDGDTLKVSGETIRLHGIDAPESRQTCRTDAGKQWRCGDWATGVLKDLVGRNAILCKGIERDRYRRLVAKCYVGGVDLGEALVRAGAAEAYTRYSLDYVGAEKAASIEGLGIWQGDVISAETYRQRNVRPDDPKPASGCAIKGNISGNGRIYHLPGQEHYDRTRIDLSRGERWFCSEAEARASGWRRARN